MTTDTTTDDTADAAEDAERATIYYDEDADTSYIAEKTVAVLGSTPRGGILPQPHDHVNLAVG